MIFRPKSFVSNLLTILVHRKSQEQAPTPQLVGVLSSLFIYIYIIDTKLIHTPNHRLFLQRWTVILKNLALPLP